MSIKKEQYFLVDIFKLLFAFVIVIHHISRYVHFYNTFVETIDFLTLVALYFYFIASGFFLFKKIKEKPEDKNKIIIRQFKRIGIMYIFWTITFIPFKIPEIIKVGFDARGQIIYWLKYLRIVLVVGESQLWFLLAILQALILLLLLMKKDKLLWCIIVSIITFTIATIVNYVPDLINHNELAEKIFDIYMKIFSSTKNGLFMGLHFMVVGCLIAKYKEKLEKVRVTYYLSSIVILGIIVLIAKRFNSALGVIADAILIAILAFISSIRVKHKDISTYIRNMSIVIYVSHIQILYFIKNVFNPSNYLIEYVAVILLSTLLSICIIAISKRIKVIKYLY